MTEDKQKIETDCYAAGDRGMMVLSQQIRAKLLLPLLWTLKRLGVTANGLTFISLLFGLTACAAIFYSQWLFLVLILLHVLADGLDGPLARYAGTASSKGSFTDTMCDQIVVAASTAVLIYLHYIGPIVGGIYIFVYTIVIAFSMVRNALSIPYSWLIRPRFIVYIWFAVEFYLLPGSLNYVVGFFSLLLILKMISGFFKIRQKL